MNNARLTKGKLPSRWSKRVRAARAGPRSARLPRQASPPRRGTGLRTGTVSAFAELDETRCSMARGSPGQTARRFRSGAPPILPRTSPRASTVLREPYGSLTTAHRRCDRFVRKGERPHIRPSPPASSRRIGGRPGGGSLDQGSTKESERVRCATPISVAGKMSRASGRY